MGLIFICWAFVDVVDVLFWEKFQVLGTHSSGMLPE